MTKLYPDGGDITPGCGSGCIEGYLDGKTGLLIKWPYFIEGVGG